MLSACSAFDLTGDPAASMADVIPALEVIGRGVLHEGAYEQMAAGLRTDQATGGQEGS